MSLSKLEIFSFLGKRKKKKYNNNNNNNNPELVNQS